MDIEPVTEKLLSGSCNAHSGPRYTHTHIHTQIGLLNGQAARLPLLVHRGVMHSPSVHQLLLCVVDEKDKKKNIFFFFLFFKGTLDGPNFMHNDDFGAREAGPGINNRKCRSFHPEFKCGTICNFEKLISLTRNAVMFGANGSKVELSRQPATA